MACISFEKIPNSPLSVLLDKLVPEHGSKAAVPLPQISTQLVSDVAPGKPTLLFEGLRVPGNARP